MPLALRLIASHYHAPKGYSVTDATDIVSMYDAKMFKLQSQIESLNAKVAEIQRVRAESGRKNGTPAIIALSVISCLSLLLSASLFLRNPLGTSLSNYDLSSPEKTLISIGQMARNRDAVAGFEFAQATAMVEANPEALLMFGRNNAITVDKAVEVKDCSNEKMNGKIIAFIKLVSSGVTYHFTQYYAKDSSGRFLPTGNYWALYDKEKQTEEDKRLTAWIKSWKASGVYETP